MGKRRHEGNKKVFGRIADRADECTAHMKTARGMKDKGEHREAERYLVSCGWAAETAHNWLNPRQRDTYSAALDV